MREHLSTQKGIHTQLMRSNLMQMEIILPLMRQFWIPMLKQIEWEAVFLGKQYKNWQTMMLPLPLLLLLLLFLPVPLLLLLRILCDRRLKLMKWPCCEVAFRIWSIFLAKDLHIFDSVSSHFSCKYVWVCFCYFLIFFATCSPVTHSFAIFFVGSYFCFGVKSFIFSAPTSFLFSILTRQLHRTMAWQKVWSKSLSNVTHLFG